MGSSGYAALAAVLLLLASALLPDPAAARVLQDSKPGSGEGAPAPTGRSEKSGIPKQLEQSSAAVQNPETGKQHQKTQPGETTQTPPPPETTQTPPPPETKQTPKDSPPPPSGVPESKGPEGGGAQVSAQPVPPTNGHNKSPPPGSPKSTGGTGEEGGASSGNKKPTKQSEEAAEKCKDEVATCSIEGELHACLQVSKTGQFFVVRNTGQNTVTVDVKATSDISVKQTLPPLKKGESKRVNISYSSPNGGQITLNVGTQHCVLHIRKPVYDWQQQFQQITSYATTVKPIYGAYFGVFTLVLVGAVFACCKFAGRKRDGGVPYQQLEMGSQAPDSSGANNTTSTGDGWEDGWDDDWDDDEAPARPSETGSAKPSETGSAKRSETGSAGSISANGLTLRSQTNSKDGWDVDWDD